MRIANFLYFYLLCENDSLTTLITCGYNFNQLVTLKIISLNEFEKEVKPFNVDAVLVSSITINKNCSLWATK